MNASELIAHFDARLQTLEALIAAGLDHTSDVSKLLSLRLAPDMAPFGTQIVYTCNQPRNLALFLGGKAPADLPPRVESLEQAHIHIADTRLLITSAAATEAKLEEVIVLHLGPALAARMTGREYANDFLLPNFYFHLVTAYAILRNAGVPLGKKDYMRHMSNYLLPSNEI